MPLGLLRSGCPGLPSRNKTEGEECHSPWSSAVMYNLLSTCPSQTLKFIRLSAHLLGHLTYVSAHRLLHPWLKQK